MSEESDLERTESATPRRLEQAREEGQVARSHELSTFLVLLAGTAGVWAMSRPLLQSLSGIVQRGLTLDAQAVSQPGVMLQRLAGLFSDALIGTLPFFAVLFAAALAAPFLLSGWVFSSAPIKFDFARLNPLSGLARMFSLHGAMELAKALAKALVVGGLAVWALLDHVDGLLALAGGTPGAAIPALGDVVARGVLVVVSGLLLIAAIDVPYQLWSYYRGLRMTREEVRQEARETEGDPQVKGRIRRAQREAARKRMMAEVPKADVIVTNPTHYAVALRYSGETMRAPKVVAKGVDLTALRIREVGAEHHVPVLEAPPLARALYRHTELGDEIPEALYTTVAELLAYVFQLRRYRDAGGPVPVAPRALPVPADMDPLAGAA